MRVLGAGFIAYMQRAVGGNHERGHLTAEPAPQFGDCRDAVAAVEVVVDQQGIRFETARLHRRQRLGEIGGFERAAAPAAKQRLHAVEDGAFVVDAEHHRAIEATDIERWQSAQLGRGGKIFCARYFDREARAVADIRFQHDLAVQHAGNAFDDRQAETETACHSRALIEPMEFAKYRAALALRDTDAGVVDLDAQLLAAPPAAHQHASRRRIFDRIGNEILQQPPTHAAIRAHALRARHEVEFQALLARQRREFDVEPVQQFVDAEIGDFRLHRAGIEPRNVEQRGEYLLDRFERGVDVLYQIAILTGALPLDQARHIKPRRIERLQNVVAGGGDESRFGDVGFVGFGLGAFGLRVEAREFAGALAHAAFQRRIGAFQRLRRLHAWGDVGEGRHQAAVGHAVRAHFDHQATFGKAFEERLAFGRISGDALGDEAVDVFGVALAVPGDVAQNLAERDADPRQFVRQIEDFAELPVPADQRRLLVEHRDAS